MKGGHCSAVACKFFNQGQFFPVFNFQNPNQFITETGAQNFVPPTEIQNFGREFTPE